MSKCCFSDLFQSLNFMKWWSVLDLKYSLFACFATVNKNIPAALSFTSSMPYCARRGQRSGSTRAHPCVSDALGGWSVRWHQPLWISTGSSCLFRCRRTYANRQRCRSRQTQKALKNWSEKKNLTFSHTAPWPWPAEEEVKSLEPTALLGFTLSCSSSDTELPPLCSHHLHPRSTCKQRWASAPRSGDQKRAPALFPEGVRSLTPPRGENTRLPKSRNSSLIKVWISDNVIEFIFHVRHFAACDIFRKNRDGNEAGNRKGPIWISEAQSSNPAAPPNPVFKHGRNDGTQLFYQARIFPTAAVKRRRVTTQWDPHSQKVYSD